MGFWQKRFPRKRPPLGRSNGCFVMFALWLAAAGLIIICAVVVAGVVRAPYACGMATARINWQRAIRVANFWLAVAWAAMIPITLYTGWIYSIAFISAASIYANFITHVAAWRADVPNDKA
jgi:hypothetical protein